MRESVPGVGRAWSAGASAKCGDETRSSNSAWTDLTTSRPHDLTDGVGDTFSVQDLEQRPAVLRRVRWSRPRSWRPRRGCHLRRSPRRAAPRSPARTTRSISAPAPESVYSSPCARSPSSSNICFLPRTCGRRFRRLRPGDGDGYFAGRHRHVTLGTAAHLFLSEQRTRPQAPAGA
ncbi:hypothetical protein FF041_29655 [Streptomyces jumonjinensis]|uniref:Uncharacterized protein n=1 Tax=Streptomyces jumonjinensis TaxID=1945 RepID=A0A646KQM0_STRJU|nr:hypothetical protein [Streptomyces jumonjinensis]